MNIDRQNAADSLSDIEHAEERMFRAVAYGRSGAMLIWWGVVVAAGNTATQFYPGYAGYIWPIAWLAGFAGMGVLLRRGQSALSRSGRAFAMRIIWAQAALLGFGALILWLLAPLEPRQLNAFWPLVFMLGYVLVGLWVGPFFIVCGLSVTALTIVGYWWSGPWFPLWMGAANGGALILGGLWLRRTGVRL